MKSGFDPFSDYAPVRMMDLERDFETLWDETEDLEKPEQTDALGGSRVWLECNGEFADLGSLRRSNIQDTVLGVEIVEFECPCCRQSHESLLFR